MNAQQVIARLDQLLRPVGFARHGKTWNRSVESFIDILDVQISKSGDMITVNTGVLDLEVHKVAWMDEIPEFIEQPSGTVCARIGELIDGKDRWWPLAENRVCDAIADKVTAHGLPFMERMHGRAAMERWLTDAEVTKRKYPLPILNLAILKSLRGDAAGACALLAALEKAESGAWRTRVAAVARQLNCI